MSTTATTSSTALTAVLVVPVPALVLCTGSLVLSLVLVLAGEHHQTTAKSFLGFQPVLPVRSTAVIPVVLY
jgi:hypothetical protein